MDCDCQTVSPPTVIYHMVFVQARLQRYVHVQFNYFEMFVHLIPHVQVV